MSRIPTPATIDAAPAASQPTLTAIKAKLGQAPNLYRLVANSPATLEALTGLSAALARGTLGARTSEAIALAVANVNGCGYCNSAHSYVAGQLLKVAPDEIAANRHGHSVTNPRTDAAVRFAVRLVETRGHASDADLAAARSAGLTDAELLEVAGHVALNTFTNYVNEAFGTEIDFPAAELARAA